MIDHEDIEARPWLYPPHVVELVMKVRQLTESLRIAQLTIDKLREDERKAFQDGRQAGLNTLVD